MPSPINLQLGWPSPRLFPAHQLGIAASTTLSNPKIAREALVYGPDLGYTPLRESIARWLSSFYQPPSGEIPIDRIMITGGASQNLASILQVFSDPNTTKVVWMVEPTYFLACRIFQDAGFSGRLRGVPENDYGLDIEFLRDALSEFEKGCKPNDVNSEFKRTQDYEKIFRHILYTTPTFSNPSAKTMPNSLREELLDLAREFDVLVISDDVYDFLRWPAQGCLTKASKMTSAPLRIVDLDRATSAEMSWGNSISNGSFSKIIAPGVRVGWAEGSSKIISRLAHNGATRSGGAPSHLTSTFIYQLFETGAMKSHIEDTLIPTYRSRYSALMCAIREHLEPLGVRIATGVPHFDPTDEDAVDSAGGFFTYVSFPPCLPSATIIAKRALEEYNLKIAYGEMFIVKDDETSIQRSKQGFGNGARLCWAWHEKSDIEEGVNRLRDLLSVMISEKAMK